MELFVACSMKWLVILILSCLAAFGAEKIRHRSGERQTTHKSSNSFALLELFTSEGCSSCPPADRLLPQLAEGGPNIITLAFHVDYWDRLGWKDPFSNSQFTDRQKIYGKHFKLESIYTPQLVINGNFELVGSNKATAEADIEKSLGTKPKVSLKIGEVKRDHNNLSVICELRGQWDNSHLLAAVVQKHAETNVKGGENHGLRLSHTNVVRTFLELPAREKLNFEIAIPANIASDNWQLIVYTQQNNDLGVTGAAVYTDK